MLARIEPTEFRVEKRYPLGMRVVEAPAPYGEAPHPWVFIAGSIDMGAAPAWQDEVVALLSDVEGTILNPRRRDWDARWRERIDDDTFRGQVEWELAAQEEADLVAMYFVPGTRSPITLLELGLFHERPMIVCCPDGYWKKGNVDIVCARYGIEQAADRADLIARIRARVRF
jgi:hypothetical protein